MDVILSPAALLLVILPVVVNEVQLTAPACVMDAFVAAPFFTARPPDPVDVILVPDIDPACVMPATVFWAWLIDKEVQVAAPACVMDAFVVAPFFTARESAFAAPQTSGP